MPKAHRAIRAGADAACLAALSRLAARGAYAAPVDPTIDGGGALGIVLPGEAAGTAGAIIAPETVALLCRRRWIAADEQRHGCYRIAAGGINELRRARSAPAGAAKPPRPPKTTLRAAPRRHARAALSREGPLAWLRRRKLITEPQCSAGERLAADFWHAQMSPRITADWSATAAGRRTRRSAPGAGVDLKDNVVAARTRVHRALAAVGPELAGILVDVCCHEVGLEPAGRTQGWPQRAAKVVLQLALTRLARHYGLLAPAPLPGAHRLRHWGDADYRPTLEAWRS